MKRFAPNPLWLLLAALLLTQALGVAHAFDHPAVGHADHACAVCAHGLGLDHVPPATLNVISQPPVSVFSITPDVAVYIDNATVGYHSRAPPLLA